MDSQIDTTPGRAAATPRHPLPWLAGRPARTRRALTGGGLLAVVLIAGLLLSLRSGNASPTSVAAPAPLSLNAAPQAPAAPPLSDAMRDPAGGAVLHAGYDASTGGAATSADRSAAPGGTAANAWDRKIIRTGTLNLVVTDVENSLATIRGIAAQANGLVFSSNTEYQGDDMVATVTIEVPVDSFDGVMTQLRKQGVKVLTETSTSQDVSQEYTDLSAQLKNQQAQEAQLRLLMSRATTVGETLAVQQTLSQVQGQIEQDQGRLNYLSHKSDLSSITITLTPKLIAASAPAPGWQPAETAARAWQASLTLLTQAGDVLITVLVFCWWLLPLLVVGWLLLRGRRRQARLAG
ncbi:MAG TPA: DUF4349 domain-containing protein [Chloroflexia bacterium]|nr:DUF4349 domain-containing protein [Chloroflexia bacterium]